MLIGRSKEKLEEIKRLIEGEGGKSVPIVADLNDSLSIIAAFQEIRETIGHPVVISFILSPL